MASQKKKKTERENQSARRTGSTSAKTTQKTTQKTANSANTSVWKRYSQNKSTTQKSAIMATGKSSKKASSGVKVKTTQELIAPAVKKKQTEKKKSKSIPDPYRSTSKSGASAIMATNKSKSKTQDNSPMGMLRRAASKSSTGRNDNYTKVEARGTLPSKTSSALDKKTRGLLSRADRTLLSSESQQEVRKQKEKWEQGQDLIDTGRTAEGKQVQKEANESAEFERMKSGYSGGEEGFDYTTPDMKRVDYATMSDEGRQNLRVAKSLYNYGAKTGSEDLKTKAAEYGQTVRLTPGSYDYGRARSYQKSIWDTPVANPNTDGNGRTMYTPNTWEQEMNKSWGTAVGQGIKGGFLTLLDTARKATQNAIANRNDGTYQSAKYTADYLEREAKKATGDRKANLEAQAVKMREQAQNAKHDDPVSSGSAGMQALRKSQYATRDLMIDADTAAGKFATKAGLSILQNAPFLAANVIPGVGQAISLGGMGALAAGQKAGELQQKGTGAEEALGRGLLSGGIEALTEKIPMDSFLKLLKNGGGANLIKAVAKQAGIEATEESASYAMNLVADKAAKDPDAKFSWKELLENAGIGAVSGALFGAGGHVIGEAVNAGTPYNRTSPTEDTTPTPTIEETPRPIQEQPTQESANPLIRASQAQEQMRTQAQEQAQANQDSRTQMQSARERLEAAQQAYRQRVQSWQERATNATAEEVPSLFQEQERLIQEEHQLQAQKTQAEREDAGQLSKNFGEETSHIDQRTAQYVSKPSVKAFQWDYPQMHQYYAQAAEALLQDVEYSKAGQFSEKGRGTVVTKSEAMMQAERMGISRADLEKALTAIINDQGQENYATAKKVELVLDEMLSKGYIPNEAGYSANKVDSQIPPNEAYITAKEAIPGAVKRDSFEAYQEQNRLALELGEVTEDQLYQEWEQGQNAAQSQAQFDPQSQVETQDTQVQPQAETQPGEKGQLTGRLLDTLRANKAAIDEGGIIAHMDGTEFAPGLKRTGDQVAEFFASLGNKVTRLGFGDIALTKRGAKDAIMHGMSRNKAIAFSAVPAVIENGVVIDEQANWKGRGWDSVTFGGKIQIGEQTYDMGVIVRKYGNESPNYGRYYLHEVLLTDEDGATVPINARTLSGNPSDTATPSSMDSVAQEQGAVNEENVDGNNPGLRDSLGSARAGFDPYSEAMNRYGTIEPGEKPARFIDVPKSMTNTDRVRKSARTFMEAEATSDELVEAFQEGVARGEWSYTPKKDKDSVERSVRVLSSENGIQKGFVQWDEVVQGNRQCTKDDIVLAEMLYKIASRNGDTATAKQLAAEIAAFGTIAGQNVQAIRLLKKATPEGKLFYVQKVVEKLNSDIAKNNGNKKNASAFTSEETKEIVQELNDIKDDALRLIHNTIESFQEGKKGKTKALSWVEQLGQDLAENASKRAMDKSQKQTPVYQTILSDLNAFMSNYVDSRKGTTKNRAAAERIKDYLANRDEYGRAWRIAQNALREKYAGNQKMLDRLEDFTENGIDYNTAGHDAVLGKAVEQAIKENGIDAKDMIVQHAFGDTSISDRLANQLVQETDATGADATIIRDGVNRWITEKVQDYRQSSEDILNTDIKKNLRDIGVTISDVLKTGSTSRKALVNDLASAITEKHGISRTAANKVSQEVAAQFETMLEDGATKKLQSMFSEQDKNAKKKLNKVVKLARLGAFSKQNYNELATSKLFQTEGIEVPDELAQKLLDADGQEEMDSALDEIYDYVADRVPKTFGIRLDAWRYFAMLSAPKTHIRNTLGNFLMQGVIKSRNTTSAALQRVFIKNAEDRTRTGVASSAARKFAAEDFERNRDLLSGNPYTTTERGEIWQRVREKAFTVDANKRESSVFWKAAHNLMKVPQIGSSWNSKMLDTEDMLFKKHTYIGSLANYLTAKGYKDSFENVPENVMEEARGHAIGDALEATFQEYSALASKLAQFEASNKIGKFVVGSTFPFKRVPINIAKTGVKYSPVGLLNSMTNGLKKVHNGDITTAEFIDDLSAGLNGTGIAVLGAFLFAQGILSAGDDDDDKQSGFDAAMGSQEYAINIPINGKTYSYTIDWMAPVAIPLFVGAEFWKAITDKDEETSFSESAISALGRMFEPLMQMTMFSGISSSIKSASYSQSDPIYAVLANMGTNYAGQFVPASLGQIARTIDPVRRTTFYDANSKVPKVIQQFLQRQGAKIPGVSQKMPEYLDAWGRNDKGSDNVLLRAVENFLSPGYASEVKTSSMEEELQRLNDVGYEGMLPSALQKSSKLDGNRMTAEQWMKRQKEQGSVAYEIMQNFMGTQEYQNLTDDQKAKFVEKAYEYAKNSGKAAAGGDTSDFAKWYEAANNAESEAGLSKEKFLSLYAYKSAIEDEAPDEAKASLKQGMWEEYINGRSDLSQEQKDYVLDKVKFWQMTPADSGAYQKAKNAGYNTPEEIQALLEAKSSFSTDGNNDINETELYNGIISATSDPAEQEKMYNASKKANSKKSWKELASEQSKKAQTESTAQAALDKSVSKDKQATFASAMENAASDKQTDAYRALTSTGASEAECKAYFAYLSAQKGWKKSWEKVKADALKGK